MSADTGNLGIMPNPPTLRDVAKLARVSVTTASWVLNNKPGISDETRFRVREAAVALGYQQRVRVATTNTRPLSVVGVLGRNLTYEKFAANGFYSHVLSGVEEECRQQNLNMLYTAIEVDDHNLVLSTLPPMLLDNKIDGALIIGTTVPDEITQLAHHIDCPIVLVDGYASPEQPFDSVLTNNIQGAYTAVSYLIRQGHTKIGLIGTSSDSYPSILERREGYLRALRDYGIKNTYIEDGDIYRHTGYESAMRLLQPVRQVTAIFAAMDNVAIGAINAVQDLGLNVPGDVSIIGFDDVDLAREMKPALTTMQIDKAMMGSAAVRCLSDRANDPDRVPTTILLGARLIVRQSVRSLNE